MDQQKIGEFLKTLRKEKNITQEDLAYEMNVSRRTVSRWETGSNLPDLAILVELADYYDVDLREIFNGERKEENMDKDLKDTMMMAADYTDEAKAKVMRRMQLLFIAATVAGIVYIGGLFIGLDQIGPAGDFISGLCLGIMFGVVIVGIIITSRNADQIAQWKREHILRKS
ncbi:MAG: helix-turn-helix domain-containing protein [Clostridiales bacterium]|nr:helix-turn-helix domain-containing protein [Clostridiales bacterium]